MANANGNEGRAAAAAVLAGAGSGSKAAAANRFIAMFGKPVFSHAGNETVYTDRRGRRSKRLASVLIPVLSAPGMSLKGSIYARQNQGESKPKSEFVWYGANQTSSVDISDDPKIQAEMAECRKHFANEFGEWFAGNKKDVTEAATVSAYGDTLDIAI